MHDPSFFNARNVACQALCRPEFKPGRHDSSVCPGVLQPQGQPTPGVTQRLAPNLPAAAQHDAGPYGRPDRIRNVIGSNDYGAGLFSAFCGHERQLSAAPKTPN